MTEAKKSPQQIRHLTGGDIAIIYLVLFRKFKEIGEPIPPFEEVNKDQIENLAALPQTYFYGEEQYPTLEAKAAILFYKINKGHLFPNGNKRMSLACMFVFIASNGMELSVTQDEATAKALEIAKSDPEKFPEIKAGLEQWVREHLRLPEKDI